MINKNKTLEKFNINIDKLSAGSHKRVIITCDYCLIDTETTYKNYIIGMKTSIVQKYACQKCKGLKAKENNSLKDRSETVKESNKKRESTCLEKYGVSHISKNPEISKKITQSNTNKTQEEKKETNEKRKKTIEEKFGKPWKDIWTEIMIDKYGQPYIPRTEESLEKAKQTNLEKYGTEYIFQSEDFKEKSKQTNLEKYGVEYHTQRNEFKELMSQDGVGWHSAESKEKRINTNIEKYGTKSPTQNEEVKNKIIQTKIERGYINFIDGKTDQEWANEKQVSRTYINYLHRHYGPDALINIDKKLTDIERLIQNILESNNINYIQHPKIKNQESGEYKFGDFLVNDLVIESNGNFWHSEEVKGKKYHKNKREFYKNNGYRSVFFHADEIIFKPKIVESIILNKLNKISNKFYARKCNIKKIERLEARDFFTKNHLMGDGSGISYGLYINNLLVSCIQLRKKDGGYEISRFCNLLFHSVVGGFSKLLNHAIKDINIKKIITFIDLRYGEGNYLIDLGFIKESEHLSFMWTDCLHSFHRMKFPGNSGKNHGLRKLWDCGQAKWIKYIK